jgi:hypothetical protein
VKSLASPLLGQPKSYAENHQRQAGIEYEHRTKVEVIGDEAADHRAQRD